MANRWSNSCPRRNSRRSSNGLAIPAVKLLQKGSAYFSPAESAAAMIVAMVRESEATIAACVQSRGAYGLADTRIGLPVKLGREGLKEIVKLSLRDDELAALAEAARSIAARIGELG
jgi:malate dehydrogenase